DRVSSDQGSGRVPAPSRSPTAAPPAVLDVDEPPARFDDDEPGIPVDESFENSRRVDPREIQIADTRRERAATTEEYQAVPPPSAERVLDKFPASTRALLTELFKAEIKGVKKLSRDQLR